MVHVNSLWASWRDVMSLVQDERFHNRLKFENIIDRLSFKVYFNWQETITSHHFLNIWIPITLVRPGLINLKCYFFNCFIVVQLQLSAFSPHPSTPPQPNPPPSCAPTLPLDFVHVSFIVVPGNPSPHCPLPPPLL